ncbi:hypothetical protein [Mycobacteroides saopaulense]|uniref:hypothetical protein n=1 Tax=Mycobacteroides saopaulense TaxID=1578165 RepID=UPI0012FF9927|nr:hypothetical protein [Mycobacteroides saopaulense]
MQKVHNETLLSALPEDSGTQGEETVLRLVRALPHIHAELPVDLLPNGLIVFTVIDDDASSPLAHLEVLMTLEMRTTHPHREFTVEVTDNGGYRLSTSLIDLDLLSNAIVYKYTHPAVETWHVAGQIRPVFNPVAGKSIFATPLFTKLEEALVSYSERQVSECRCQILQNAWLDARRLIWKRRPEVFVRRSLEQHLVSSLRAVVEVEHVVDETKPVDIHVHWPLSTQAALIECKWMGTSASDKGADGKRKVTDFGPSTAVMGLGQLADYLDRKRSRTDGRNYKGYLAVVDGRRKGVSVDSAEDDSKDYQVEDLFHYEYSAIDWPEHLISRPDIGPPLRAFCRPISN